MPRSSSLAFPVLGPVGVVAVRQYVAAVVLLAVSRPAAGVRLGRSGSACWRWCSGPWTSPSIRRSTASAGAGGDPEFLAGFSIALAALRRRVDACCAVIAAVGVVTLMPFAPLRRLPRNGLRAAGRRLLGVVHPAQPHRRPSRPGRRGPPHPAGLSALLFPPVGVAVTVRHPPTPTAVGCAVAAGVLSSAVPCLADLFTLRRVPAPAFGLFMSVNPVLASLVGWVVLGQSLDRAEWTGIGAVVAANALGVWLHEVDGHFTDLTEIRATDVPEERFGENARPRHPFRRGCLPA